MKQTSSEKLLRGLEVEISNKRDAALKSSTEGGVQERELIKRYTAYTTMYNTDWPRTAAALILLRNNMSKRHNTPMRKCKSVWSTWLHTADRQRARRAGSSRASDLCALPTPC